MIGDRLTCACCGYRALDGRRGEAAVCPVCFWADDPAQLNDPRAHGGANPTSLAEAQASFQARGWSDPAFAGQVRTIDLRLDERDPAWRPWVDALDAGEPRSAEHPGWPRVYWLEPRPATVGS